MTAPRPWVSPPAAAATAPPGGPPSTSPSGKRPTPTASPSTDQPRPAPAGATVAAMDATDPVARAHHQLRDDLELVEGYGRDEAAGHFGGCYWDNQPPVTIVALFTAEVDRHQMVLGRRVTQPARLVVRATPGSWRQLQADHEEITAMLLTTRTEPGVHSVGIGLRGGRFVVCVDIEPY